MATRDRLSLPALAFVWLGGVAFVAALATYVHFFAVTLATPGPPGSPLAPAVAWNVTLFAIFAVHHSALARTGAKAWVARTVSARLERSVYVWVASLLLVVVCITWQRVPGTLYVLEGVARWAGAGAQLFGVVLTVAGARVLHPLDLAGVRQAGSDGGVSAIRVVWPFTLVRHPIYLGWALIVFGTQTMTLDRMVWAVLSTGYLILAMPWEERSLSAAAGPAYSAYCQRVRWRILPGVY